MLKFPPSLLAAAAIFTAQCTIIGSKQWSTTSQCECSKHVVTLHQNAATGKLTGCLRLETLHLSVKARMETIAVRLVRDRMKTTGDVTKARAKTKKTADIRHFKFI
ncbi:hypothetical protein QQ045_011687 [Rhodiola kirilowii]